MPLLEAFLALALTMLSLAMIATLLVEFFHRLARTRANDLKGMLEEFYDSELKKFVEKDLKKTGEALDKHKEEFIERLIANPLIKEGEEGNKAGFIKSSLKQLASLSTEDFFKRLAYTDIGKQVKAKAEGEIDEFVDSLSRAYDAFGVAANDLFKRRAQVISLAAGILVAFGLNVNALLVFQSYLDDPLLRAKVVAQADAISAKLTERINKGEDIGFKNEEKAKEFVRSFKSDVGSLEKMGVTIGYSLDVQPGKLWPKEKPKKTDEPTFPEKLRDTVFWAVGVFGTGLLIGLGGPFWFNVVRKLTDVLQVVRGGAPAAAEPSDSADAPADPMKSNKDTFKMTDRPPPLVKAQANLTTATKAATDADKAVKAAADAVTATQDVLKNDPNEDQAIASAAVAKDAMKMATDVQQKMYEAKKVADESMANAAKSVAAPTVAAATSPKMKPS